jgi:segregation and condensation protein B
MSKKVFENIKQVIEALIFASDEPISAEQIKGFIEETTPSEVRKTVEELNLEYSRTNRAIQIIHVAGGYQMVTREAYSQWVKKLFHKRFKTRLSQAALETLSVIAFNQPVSNSEVSAIRGVNCDGVLRTLLERKLITISGRGNGPGRPLLYKTTKEFLRYFGVNSIADLPKPREIEEILKEKEKLPEEARDMDLEEVFKNKKSEETGGSEKSEEQIPSDLASHEDAAE